MWRQRLFPESFFLSLEELPRKGETSSAGGEGQVVKCGMEASTEDPGSKGCIDIHGVNTKSIPSGKHRRYKVHLAEGLG